MIHKYIPIILIFISSIQAEIIHIAVASNMGYVIKPLKAAFEKHYPQSKVVVSLGSSGKLSAQIMHGAPYEIFISADMFFAKHLYDEGFATSAPKIYAQGALLLFSIKKCDFSKGIHCLENKKLRTIAIANPKTAPYGKAAMEVLKHSDIYTKIVSKLVYAESIGQTISYVLNAADIGLVAKSSLFTPNMEHFHKNEHWIEVDRRLYSPINQGIVILKNAAKNKEIEDFYLFMFSKEAKKILNNFGYYTP